MKRPPLILLTPCVQPVGFELGDRSSCLSNTYQQAILRAGGLPLILPTTLERAVLAAAVSRADGVMLTGGGDVDPGFYAPGLPPELRAKVQVEDIERDWCEMRLIEEVFQQRRSLLAICRGQQILNVALGGSLLADIPSQVSSTTEHRRMDAEHDLVHEVDVQPGSLLEEITGRARLGVNSIHHQAVDQVAEPLEVIARAPDGIIEALGLKAQERPRLPFLLAVQYHPERLADQFPEHRALFDAFVAACAADAWQRDRASGGG
jgi:putative glutamine amidotransferase